MNGFVIKELLQLKREKLWTAIVMLITTMLFAVGTINGFVSFAVIALNAYIAGNIMSADVRTAWNRWCVTTPLGRKKIIESKYFIVELQEIAEIFMAVIGVVIFKTLGINENTYAYSFGYIALVSALLIFADTVTLVLIFWRGSYRGYRIALIINLILIIAVAGYADIQAAFEYLPLIFIAAVIIRAASRTLSIRLYEQRNL